MTTTDLAQRGCIYMVGDGEFIKIGYSAAPSPDLRAKSLQVANARDLRILAFCAGTLDEETTLHGRFSAHAVRGEWFLSSDEIEKLAAGIMKSREQIELGRLTVLEVADRVFGTERPREIPPCPPVPDGATKFEAWAHNACCKWPADLQAQSYRAWQSMVRPDLYAREEYTKFVQMFADWFDRQPLAA